MFWRSLAHLLTEIHEAAEIEIARLEYQQDLAVFQAAIMTEKQTENIAKAVDRSLDALRNRLQPWYRKEREAAVKDLARQMDVRWSEAWGDPDDPAVKARIEEVRQALQPKQPQPGKPQPKQPQHKKAQRWQPKKSR